MQLSVFEADVTEKELKRLKVMLTEIELEKDDSIRLYQICETCFKKVKIWGSGEVTKDREYYFG